jgi:thiol-disulfide isomerase/thioredoxin
MRDFGVPAALAGTFAALIPLAELACVVALIVSPWTRSGAIGAGVLLVAFSGAIAVNLALGRRPDCRCFGQLRTSPAGSAALVRNGVLAGISAFVALRGPGDVPLGLESLSSLVRRAAASVPLWVFALAVVWIAAAIWMRRTITHLEKKAGQAPVSAPPAANPDLRAVAPLRPLPDHEPDQQHEAPNPIPLPMGAPAPSFTMSSLGGDVVTIAELGGYGRPLLLLFTQPHCGACDAVLSDVARWQREHADRLLIVPISKYGFEANRDKVRTYKLGDLWVQQGDEIGNAYGVHLFPTAVVVEDGRIASELAEGRDAIRALVTKAAGRAGACHPEERPSA